MTHRKPDPNHPMPFDNGIRSIGHALGAVFTLRIATAYSGKVKFQGMIGATDVFSTTAPGLGEQRDVGKHHAKHQRHRDSYGT